MFKWIKKWTKKRKKEKLYSSTDLFDELAEKHRNRTTWDEFIDNRKKLRSHKDNYRWFVRTQIRFWLLTHIFRKKPILVHEWSDFKDGAGWLDVSIDLPSLRGFQGRWIFTVSSRHHILDNDMEHAQTDIYFHMRANRQEVPKHMSIWKPLDFWSWLEDNIDYALETPIIEYDNVYVNQDKFYQEDVVKWTKAWLQKWYPKLAERDIVWKEWSYKELGLDAKCE